MPRLQFSKARPAQQVSPPASAAQSRTQSEMPRHETPAQRRWTDLQAGGPSSSSRSLRRTFFSILRARASELDRNFEDYRATLRNLAAADLTF